MTYSIRQASLSDLEIIRELTFKVWPQTYAAILSESQINYMLDLMYSIPALTKQLTDPEHAFILVYDEELPVGFASYSPHHNEQWKLHKLYILPAMQGKGLGKLILDYIISDLRKRGINSLVLNVNRYNQASLFYKKLGFKIIEETDVPIGNGYFMNDYIMEIKMEDTKSSK